MTRPPLELLGCAHQHYAATDDDALLKRGAGGVQRIVDAILALLHLLSEASPTRMIATPPASFAVPPGRS
jgi:hypothetical protein